MTAQRLTIRQKAANRDGEIAVLFPKPPARSLVEQAATMQNGWVRQAILTHLGLTEDDLALCKCGAQAWKHDELGRCPE